MEPGILAGAMAHIDAHPEEWNQLTWICGTTACLAGRIAIMAGAKPGYGYDQGYSITGVWYLGEAMHVSDVAEIAAGLTHAEAQYLFAPDRTRDELRQATARLTEDLAIEASATKYMADHHNTWHDTNGTVIVSAHRRTAFVVNVGGWSSIDFPDRERAYNYADDMGTARLLTFRENEDYPEAPK